MSATNSSGIASARAPGRWIDPRGHRFGAAVSAGVLTTSIVLAQPVLVLFTALALAVSAAFGTRYSFFGRLWPPVRSVLRLGTTEPEHEYPPRFAQALGALFLAIGLILLATAVTPWGWLPVAAVIGLQIVLAATGVCIGCRLYFIRWYVPLLFTRLIERGRAAARG